MLHVARGICDAPRWLGVWAQLRLQEKSLAPATKYTGHLSTKAVCSASTGRMRICRQLVSPPWRGGAAGAPRGAGRSHPSVISDPRFRHRAPSRHVRRPTFLRFLEKAAEDGTHSMVGGCFAFYTRLFGFTVRPPLVTVPVT